MLEFLLIKLQTFSTATLLKIDSNTGVFFLRHCTKMKLFIKDYFSKHDKIHRKLRWALWLFRLSFNVFLSIGFAKLKVCPSEEWLDNFSSVDLGSCFTTCVDSRKSISRNAASLNIPVHDEIKLIILWTMKTHEKIFLRILNGATSLTFPQGCAWSP